MSQIKSLSKRRQIRHRRVRARVSGVDNKPRLSVFRSNKHIQASLVDDVKGNTLLAVNSVKIKSTGSTGFRKVDQAFKVGEEIARLAKDKGITKVVFDRGGYRYTGRVKSVAEGARSGGLEF